jgi:hypothetical protein
MLHLAGAFTWPSAKGDRVRRRFDDVVSVDGASRIRLFPELSSILSAEHNRGVGRAETCCDATNDSSQTSVSARTRIDGDLIVLEALTPSPWVLEASTENPVTDCETDRWSDASRGVF